MALPAPAAGRIGARGVPEAAHQSPRLRKLVADPGRHHRVAASHGKPCQGIGQRPAEVVHVRNDIACPGRAGGALQPPSDRRPSRRPRRPVPPSKPAEEPVQGAVHAPGLGGAQPVPCGEQVRCGLRQRLALVAIELQRNAGVELGIVHPAALQTAVLVVLDETVIGVAGEGERAETQRVDGREFQKPEGRLRRRQVRQVEGDQVVSQQEGRALGEVVQPRKYGSETAARMRQTAAGIRPYCPDGMNPVVPADLEIQGNAGRPEEVTIPALHSSCVVRYRSGVDPKSRPSRPGMRGLCGQVGQS